MRKSRDQHIYDELFRRSTALGYDTYPSMPPEDVALPFVKIGEVTENPEPTKSHRLGTLNVTIDVWAHGDRRIDASTMLTMLEIECQKISELDGARYSYNDSRSSKRVLPDNSSTHQLWRGMLSAEFLILR